LLNQNGLLWGGEVGDWDGDGVGVGDDVDDESEAFITFLTDNTVGLSPNTSLTFFIFSALKETFNKQVLLSKSRVYGTIAFDCLVSQRRSISDF